MRCRRPARRWPRWAMRWSRRRSTSAASTTCATATTCSSLPSMPASTATPSASGGKPGPDTLEPVILSLYEYAKGITPARFLAAVSALNIARRKLARFYTRHDIWLSPTTSRVAEPWGKYNLSRPGVSAANNVELLLAEPCQFTVAAQHHGHAGHVAAARHAFHRACRSACRSRAAPPTSIWCCSWPPCWSRPCRGAIACRRCMWRSWPARLVRAAADVLPTRIEYRSASTPLPRAGARRSTTLQDWFALRQAQGLGFCFLMSRTDFRTGSLCGSCARLWPDLP